MGAITNVSTKTSVAPQMPCSIYYTHNSGHIEKWVTRFLDTLTNQIPVNGQIPK